MRGRCAFCFRGASDVTAPAMGGVVYVCCERCATHDDWIKFYERKHTPECNLREYPNMRGAEYLDDPMAGVKLIKRLKRVVAFSQTLQEELRTISEVGPRVIPTWPPFLEMMLSHLRIDLDYLESAARNLSTDDPKIAENSLRPLHDSDGRQASEAGELA